MKNKLLKSMMLSCQKATELIEEKQLYKLDFVKEIQLKMHLSVCNACKKYSKQSELINDLLSYFVQGGDTTGFGAVQSLTYLAQKVQPDLRYELETASVSILDNIESYDRPAVKNYNQLTLN
ncbi:MAG: hypothetical protein ACPL1A_06600 [Candidatus Kapaibacteriota bacterium]